MNIFLTIFFLGLIGLLTISIILFFYKEFLRIRKESFQRTSNTTVGDVYKFFKETGYLKETAKGNFKFSTSRLRVLIKNEELSSLDIETWEKVKIPGVGLKVKELIKHLISEYKRLEKENLY